MRVPFIKMHGLGNDFVVLDGRARSCRRSTDGCARALADRRTGIGCDQLIVLEPSDAADFRMRIRNSDGGEVEACGNATRAVALLHGQPARIETAGGILEVRPDNGGVSVDMGEPRFEWDAIPLSPTRWTRSTCRSAWDDLERPSAVNVGNPHVVFFVARLRPGAARRGSARRSRPTRCFPEGVNVNVATVESRGRNPPAGVGTRRGADPGLRHRRLRHRGRGDAPQAGRARGRWCTLPGGKLLIGWGEDNRIIDDRSGHRKLPRQVRLGRVRVSVGSDLARLPAEYRRKRGASGRLLAERATWSSINSCAVTAEAVRQTRQAIRRARRARPDARLLVTGCAAEIEREQLAAMPEVDGLVANAAKLDARAWNVPARPAPVAARGTPARSSRCRTAATTPAPSA